MDMNRRDLVGRILLCIIMMAGIALLSASCATRGDFSELRQEMNTNARVIESRLSVIEQTVAQIDSLVGEQLLLNQSLRAMLGTQAREQAEKIATVTARQDDINYLLKELLEKLQIIQLYGGLESKKPQDIQEKAPVAPLSAAPSPATPQPEFQSPQVTTKVTPETLYETALKDVEQENYMLAENRFLTFLLQYPDHTLAPNAQYWLGETFYVQGMYEQAIKEFEKVTEKYTKSEKVRAALLKIGFSQIESGDTNKGKTTLQSIVKKYKSFDEAALAREKLKGLE